MKLRKSLDTSLPIRLYYFIMKQYFWCVIGTGATGTRCETITKLCDTSPTNPTCKNGGHCINRPNGFQCLCTQGFSGDTWVFLTHKPCIIFIKCNTMPTDFVWFIEPYQGNMNIQIPYSFLFLHCLWNSRPQYYFLKMCLYLIIWLSW